MYFVKYGRTLMRDVVFGVLTCIWLLLIHNKVIPETSLSYILAGMIIGNGLISFGRLCSLKEG